MTIASTAAARPTLRPRHIAVLGFVVAAGTLGGALIISRLDWSSGSANASAMAAGWSASSATVHGRLTTALDLSAGGLPDWSPIVVEGKRHYQAIWLDPDDRDDVIRAYVDDRGVVTSLSISDSLSANLSRDAKAIIDTAIPAAPAKDRSAAADALAALAQAGKPSSITVHGVAFAASSGSIHYTLQARPAA